MRRRIDQLTNEAKLLKSEAERYQAALALFRIVLQYATTSCAEWIVSRIVAGADPQSPLPIDKLLRPADGDLVATLSELVVAAENLGWNHLHECLWKRVANDRPAMRLVDERPAHLEQLLLSFVSKRNNSVAGHGIIGDFDTEADLDLISLCLDQLAPLLPTWYESSQTLLLSGPKDGNSSVQIRLLKVINGTLICYREIKRLPGARCRILAQQQLTLSQRCDVAYEVDDLLAAAAVTATYPNIDVIPTKDVAWRPWGRIPERTTEADEFVGREAQLRELAEWFDDTGSRACQIYADGGLGKTTLALEFLHRLFEGRQKTVWKPDLITYYSAKQTRWGLNGLERISAEVHGISDAPIQIVRGLEGPALDRSWFTLEPFPLFAKAQSLLMSYGIKREQHLLILDNTETLIRSQADAQVLGKQVTELTRRIGRVVVTSRRREDFEARPIEVPALSDDEAEALLRKRGGKLNRVAIKQAGQSTLRKYARRLGNKPLVLEVFVQTLSDSSIALKAAFERVLRMQERDLGDFLFDDAWNRFSSELKLLLLLMARISDEHDEFLLKLCCHEVRLSVMEAERALHESKGIASINRFSGERQISLNHDFVRFCSGRTMTTVGGQLVDLQAMAARVKKRYDGMVRSAQFEIKDGVSPAFRHAMAKAAYVANRERRFDDALLYFEEAVEADRDNAALRDRFAHFLLRQRHYDEAHEQAHAATSKEPKQPEYWFTRGMIEARRGKLEAALAFLQKAEDLKKPAHLCDVQRAHAYLKHSPADPGRAMEALRRAEKVPQGTVLRDQHLAEVRRLQSKARYEASRAERLKMGQAQ